MGKAVEVRIHGLKCDAEGCGHFDETVTFEQYESFLNSPCPKCGASLLTPADLAACKLVIALAEWENVLIGPVNSEGPLAHFDITMDGSGTFDVGEITDEANP